MMGMMGPPGPPGPPVSTRSHNGSFRSTNDNEVLTNIQTCSQLETKKKDCAVKGSDTNTIQKLSSLVMMENDFLAVGSPWRCTCVETQLVQST